MRSVRFTPTARSAQTVRSTSAVRSLIVTMLVAAMSIGAAVVSGSPAYARTAAAAPARSSGPIPTFSEAAQTSSILTVEKTVDPKQTQVNDTYFEGVSASGPGEAWAVGTYADKKALDHPLAEHWNGTSRSRVAVPQPTGQQALFHGVDDLAPDDAWAVGTSFSGGVGATPAGLTLIEHWDGSAWSIVPSPNPATGVNGDSDVLEAISGTGPDDLWAAGWDNDEESNTIALLFEHWDGKTWQAVTSPTPGGSFQFAFAITAVNSDDVWAVGSDDTGQPVTLVANWNGKVWSITDTPNFNGGPDAQNELTGVSATGPDNVWASGFADNVNDDNLADPYVLHWNGKDWTLTKVPNPNATKEGSRLNAIQALSPTDAWAVGQTQKNNGSILTLAERYNGSSWTISPSPDPGMLGNLVDNSLDGVGSAGGSNLFAVGADEMTGHCCLRTLAIGTSQG
jgi:hypothetical protein